jgi:hypothetical protein
MAKSFIEKCVFNWPLPFGRTRKWLYPGRKCGARKTWRSMTRCARPSGHLGEHTGLTPRGHWKCWPNRKDEA